MKNYGPSPMFPHFLAYIRKLEYELCEPSILYDFDLWFLWAKCKHSGVPIEEYQRRGMLARMIAIQTERLLRQMELEIMKGLNIPSSLSTGTVTYSQPLLSTPSPCYVPKCVLTNAIT